MAICSKLWGKRERELIPFLAAEHRGRESSEIALGKSKGGEKALLSGCRSSKRPWATVSALVPSGGAPHALQGRTGLSSSLGELRCSSGTGAEVPGSAAKKTAADQRLRPRRTTRLGPSPARGLISPSFGRAAPSPVSLPSEASRFSLVRPGSRSARATGNPNGWG